VRVGLVTSLDGGGPLEHSMLLARGLSTLGADVRAVCASEAIAERFAEQGAAAVVIPLRHTLDWRHGARIRRVLDGVDVVHAQDRRSGLWTRALPRPDGAVRVYTIHGLPDPFLPPPAGPARPGLRGVLAYRGLDAALALRTDALITPSQAMAAQLVDRLGIPRRRLAVIPNGVDVPAAPQPPGAAVGTISVLEPVKGLGTFLEAAGRLAPLHPDVPFVIYGTGSEAPWLRRRVDELGLGDRVRLAGYAPAREALRLLRVYALPSIMENSPMGLLEAMAAGVPAVASRVGGVPELGPSGTVRLVAAGDPVALADAVDALLRDAEAAAAQAAAARAHVMRDGTSAVMTARTAALYERLLERRVP
jgi:glycosyltransferase involved in cell wall biosynthesis